MKVDSSHSSHYTSLFGQSGKSTDDDTPFVLPDDDDGETKTTAAPISSAGLANSISSGFWLNQSGGSAAADADGLAASDGDLSSDDILSQFTKLADMTPAEKIRAQYLAQQNLTEEQFAQLPSDQQKAISDQIADQIKQQLGAGKSAAADGDSDSDSLAVSLG